MELLLAIFLESAEFHSLMTAHTSLTLTQFLKDIGHQLINFLDPTALVMPWVWTPALLIWWYQTSFVAFEQLDGLHSRYSRIVSICSSCISSYANYDRTSMTVLHQPAPLSLTSSWSPRKFPFRVPLDWTSVIPHPQCCLVNSKSPLTTCEEQRIEAKLENFEISYCIQV